MGKARGHRASLQVHRTGKGPLADARHAFGDDHVGQIGQPGKGPAADIGHAARDDDAGQAGAGKGVVPDAPHVATERDVGQITKAGKEIGGNFSEVDLGRGQTGTAEGVGPDVRDAATQHNIGQGGAGKSVVPDARYAVRKNDALDSSALEGVGPDAGHAFGDDHVGQLCTEPESRSGDAGPIGRDRDTAQSRSLENTFTDDGQRSWQHHIAQRGGVAKSARTQASRRGGNVRTS